jgi:hypothetical protein
LFVQPFFPVVGSFPSEAILPRRVASRTPRTTKVVSIKHTTTIRATVTIRTGGAAPRRAAFALFGVVAVGTNLHHPAPTTRALRGIGKTFPCCIEYSESYRKRWEIVRKDSVLVRVRTTPSFGVDFFPIGGGLALDNSSIHQNE